LATGEGEPSVPFKETPKYGGLEVSELMGQGTVKSNSRLKRIYAELALENEAFKEGC
jgi:hypothetical protein